MSPTGVDSGKLDPTQEVGSGSLKSPLSLEGSTKDAVNTVMQLPEKLAGPGDSIKLEKKDKILNIQKGIVTSLMMWMLPMDLLEELLRYQNFPQN